MNKTNVFKSSEFYMGVGDILHMIILEEEDIFPDIELINGGNGTVEDGTVTAPTANIAIDQTASSFVANWEEVAVAEGYYLDVATDSGFTSMVSGFDGLDVGDVTSYLVDGLPDDTYYYRIRAYKGDEESESSNVIEVAAVSWDFGYLYTKAVIDDIREIAASGWSMPTEDDFSDLQMELEPWEFTAYPLMDTDPMFWDEALATNELLFNAKGAGVATETYFNRITEALRLWIKNTGIVQSIDIEHSGIIDDGSNAAEAISIRLVKESTILTHGQTSIGAYTGNDGKTYDSVCIGTKEWLSRNLAETQFRDSFKVIYGFLYNGYVANDARNITSAGWHIASVADYLALLSFLDPTGSPTDNDVARQLKEIGTTYWNNAIGVNSVGFNLRGSGIRSDAGAFSDIKGSVTLMTTDENSGNVLSCWTASVGEILYCSALVPLVSYALDKNFGMSIRLVKDTTTLTHGETGTYTGNDGKVYRTICIGTQEWLADNLCETQFRDTAVKYGALYNWYAATDVRSIAAEGDFSVPNAAQILALRNYLDPVNNDPFTNLAGGIMKETGVVYWNTPNTGASNSVGFNARGAGRRDGSTGAFLSINGVCTIWNTRDNSTTDGGAGTLNFDSEYFFQVLNSGTNKSNGCTVRLVRAATVDEQLLDDGTACDPYTGNDGKIYRTVKIGTQVWLADNLCETKYRNGEDIPIVTDNAAWVALTDAGMCYYDNDIDNAIWDVNIEEVTDAGSWAAIETSAMCSYNNDTDYSYIDSDDITSALLSGSPDFDEPLRLAYDDNEAYV